MIDCDCPVRRWDKRLSIDFGVCGRITLKEKELEITRVPDGNHRTSSVLNWVPLASGSRWKALYADEIQNLVYVSRNVLGVTGKYRIETANEYSIVFLIAVMKYRWILRDSNCSLTLVLLRVCEIMLHCLRIILSQLTYASVEGFSLPCSSVLAVCVAFRSIARSEPALASINRVSLGVFSTWV